MNIDNKQQTKRIIDLEKQVEKYQRNEEDGQKRIKKLEDSIYFLLEKVSKMEDKILELKKKKSHFLENRDSETDNENFS